jgi:hypothetical protein
MINNKMNKLGVLVITTLLTSVVFGGNGDTRYGPATKFEVTLKKAEFCTDSVCTTAHTLVTKTSAMNISSAAVGAEVGSYASTMTLPPMGVTYTHMRSTVDRTFSITGYAASSGTASRYCHTDGSAGGKTAYAAGTFVTTAAAAATAATASALEAPTPSVNITTFINGGTDTTSFSMTYDTGYAVSGDDMTVITALTTPYTYYGQTPIIDISFATTTGVSSVEAGSGDDSNDCNLFPGPPTMIITIK